MPLSLLVYIGSLLYALVSVFHPDWLMRSNFRLRRSDSLHKDSHQNSWIYPRVKREREVGKTRTWGDLTSSNGEEVILQKARTLSRVDRTSISHYK